MSPGLGQIRTERRNQEFDSTDLVDRAEVNFRRLYGHFDIGQQAPESLRTDVLFDLLLRVPPHEIREHVVVFRVLEYPASPASSGPSWWTSRRSVTLHCT